jgi:hypothetical protein
LLAGPTAPTPTKGRKSKAILDIRLSQKLPNLASIGPHTPIKIDPIAKKSMGSDSIDSVQNQSSLTPLISE